MLAMRDNEIINETTLDLPSQINWFEIDDVVLPVDLTYHSSTLWLRFDLIFK